MSATSNEGGLITVADSNENSSPSPPGSLTVSPTPACSALSCEMCQNYEVTLKNTQDDERKLREELKAVKGLAERYETELLEERQYRQNLEKKMMETAAETEEKLNDCVRSYTSLSESLQVALESSTQARSETEKRLDAARDHLSLVDTEYSELSHRFERLLGVKSATAAAMREEAIDISSDVDQLQFLCLKLREELIDCKASREFSDAELKDEVTALASQLQEEKRARETREAELVAQVNALQTDLGIANSQISTAEDAAGAAEEQSRQMCQLRETIGELEGRVQQIQSERAALEQTAANFRARCSTLQQDLDVSEQVQKDFVQLSQSLQIQLEKIRQSDQACSTLHIHSNELIKEVRWQWEDEVTECSSPSCSSSVAKLRPKPRCLHCGKIFCSSCVSSTVAAGRSGRAAPVCAVCHTLLNRDSAPFFSRDPSGNHRKTTN